MLFVILVWLFGIYIFLFFSSVFFFGFYWIFGCFSGDFLF